MATGHNLIEKAAGAHGASIRTPPAELAGYLQEMLGQKLVAHIVGIKDPKDVGRWARASRPPSKGNQKQLRDLSMIVRLLLDHEAQPTVRAWLTGMNPQLGDEAPADLLRAGRVREVMAAARAFVADG